VEAPESESMQSDNAPLEQPSLLSPARPVAPPRWGALADYLSLTKPRIIVLLLVTTLGAMVVAAGGWPSWPLVAATLLGGALASGAGNALNCYLDRDIDALMGRTVWRPLPSGALAPGQALAFGLALAALSFLVLGLWVNLLAAVLAQAGLWFYVLVYTRWLKRTTPSNIVIGGAAGAVPPLVGWAAVTGELSLLAWCLFAIVFYWTPPHFWALALLIREEYAKARVPMLPLVAGDAETRRQILWYSVLLLAVSLLPFAFGLAGLGYLVAAGGLGGLLVRYAVRLCREATRAAALALYKYSLLYLALVFTALVADRLLGG
jgi:protoheme IX farnesyltransferase